MAAIRDSKEKRAERTKKDSCRDSKYDFYTRNKPSEHAERFFRRPAYDVKVKRDEE